MYSLVSNLLGIPAQNPNSTVTYVSAALVILFTVIVVDMVYKLIKLCIGRK